MSAAFPAALQVNLKIIHRQGRRCRFWGGLPRRSCLLTKRLCVASSAGSMRPLRSRSSGSSPSSSASPFVAIRLAPRRKYSRCDVLAHRPGHARCDAERAEIGPRDLDGVETGDADMAGHSASRPRTKTSARIRSMACENRQRSSRSRSDSMVAARPSPPTQFA